MEWLLVYFGLGLIVLGVLELFTRRITRGIRTGSIDAQTKLAASGSYVSPRGAAVLLIGALWLFWPLVILSALTSKGGKRDGKQSG